MQGLQLPIILHVIASEIRDAQGSSVFSFVGLLDLDGKAQLQYFLYKLLYELTGRRAGMSGTGAILRGLASRNDEGTLSVFLVNYGEKGTPDGVVRCYFNHAPEGVYRMNVYRIDFVAAANMKASPMGDLPAAESRVTYVHSNFQFDVFTPADTVTLVQFVKEQG